MKKNNDLKQDNVTSLFQMKAPLDMPDEQAMFYYLDQPDDSEEKRAFLNQCVLSDAQLEELNQANNIIDAGKRLDVHQPVPAIRANVLEAASAAVADISEKPQSVARSRFRTWRWAWAAVFAALLWGGHMGMQQNEISDSFDESDFEYQLLTVEDDIDLLQASLDLDSLLDYDGSA